MKTKNTEKNILFFLTPKSEVEYLEEDSSIRQAIERMEYHNYTCIPILSMDGKYIRSVSDGDILRYIKKYDLNLEKCEDHLVVQVDQIREICAIHINKKMVDLLDMVVNQNFVPVLDDMDNFIGIITRKHIIEYLGSEIK